jgi:hypothetical protein
MKKIAFCLFLFFCAKFTNSQPLPGSVIVKYKAAKTDKEKGTTLLGYIKKQSVTDTKTKEDILVLKTWFEKQNDEVGKN